MQQDGVVDRLVVAVTYAYDKAAEAAVSLQLGTVVKAVGVASVAWAGLAVSAARAADEAFDAARRIGMTTAEYTALSYAADRSGTSMEVLGRGLVTIQRAMAQAKTGKGPVAEAFRDIGLGAESAAGKLGLAADALPRIIEGLRRIEDPGKRASTALLLLGEAGPGLAQMIEGGSAGLQKLTEQAHRYGRVIDDDMAEPSGELIDAIDDMGDMAEGAARRIGFALVPALARAARGTSTWLGSLMESGGQLDRVFGAVDRLGKGIDGVLSTGLGRVTVATLAFAAAWGTLGAARSLVTAASATSPLAAGLLSVAGGLKAGLVAVGPFALAAAGTVLVLDDLAVAADGGDSAIGRLAKSLGVESELQAGLRSVKTLLGEAGSFATVAASAIGTDLTSAFDRLADSISGLFDAWNPLEGTGLVEAMQWSWGHVKAAAGSIPLDTDAAARGFSKARRFAEGDLGVQAIGGNIGSMEELALMMTLSRQRDRALNYGPQQPQVTTGPITVNSGPSREEIARAAAAEVERQVLAGIDVSR